MSHTNDPSKMVQTVFQTTRKKSAGVGSFWWKHLGGLLYDFLVICGCAIFIAVFCRVGSVWVGSFLFQWKHGLSLKAGQEVRVSGVLSFTSENGQTGHTVDFISLISHRNCGKNRYM